MIQSDEIKQLLQDTDENTLTLYLNVDPRAPENVNTNPAWHIWAKDALRSVGGEVSQQDKQTWADIRARADQFLADYQPQSKSLALLVGPSFERSFEFPFAIDNQITYGKPNVMPLLWALDEYEPYLIALVDQAEARFFLSYLGQIGFQDSVSVDWNIGEGPEFTAFPSNHDVGRGGSQDAVKNRHGEQAARMYRDVVAHLQHLTDKHRARRIILGGSEQAAHHVRSLMPDKMAQAVVAVLPVPILAYTQEMTERIQPTALEYERQQEIILVQDVINLAKSGGRGALGWEGVRLALQMQQVELLILPWPVVDENQAADLTLKTFASGGTVELVHGEAAALLGGEGGLAARLYYAL